MKSSMKPFAGITIPACMALIVSYSIPGAEPQATTGSLVIAIGNSLSKTLVPALDMAPASYIVQGTGPDNATLSGSTASAGLQESNLAPGSWTIIATTKNAAGQAIGTGQTVATVNAGATRRPQSQSAPSPARGPSRSACPGRARPSRILS